jgi:hypothetical protein
VKLTSSPQDEEIIELLKRLGTLRAEYPAELLAARRAAFAAQIEERKVRVVNKDESFTQEEVIEILEDLKPVKAEYPPELLSARRAAFIAQIEQHVNRRVKEKATSQDQLLELLGNLKSATVAYPPELLSARRAAFLAQIEQRNNGHVPEKASTPDPLLELFEKLKSVPPGYQPDLLSARREAFIAKMKQANNEQVPEALPPRDQVIELLGHLKAARIEYPADLLAARREVFLAQIEQHNRVAAESEPLPAHNGSIFNLFGRLKSIDIEYPRKLWSTRRSVFVAQIRDGKVTVLEALHSAVKNLFIRKKRTPVTPVIRFTQASMVLATLLLAVFVGSLAFGNRRPLTQIFGSSPAQPEGPHPSPLAAVTSTGALARVICKPGYLPPLCLAQEFDQSSDLSFPGNGSARPAVAKDTLPGYSRIHQAAYANDGLYGPGASWISNSAYSWIKIDLGDVRTINTVTFGRDRLGNLNDGDPGQFVIAIALHDDVYADGNSQNDFREYTRVYDSEAMGFNGIISGPETIEARFDPVQARFVKITFENAGTAVDEIEAFLIQPFGLASNPTQRPRDTRVPPSFTPIPTNTLIPSRTPTLIPTNTFVPTRTPTLIPTITPFPTDTATPRPTNTDVPTDTPEPPTDTPEPPPTDTPEPPTDTPEPPPSDTSEPPPTFTGEPLLPVTETPETPDL